MCAVYASCVRARGLWALVCRLSLEEAPESGMTQETYSNDKHWLKLVCIYIYIYIYNIYIYNNNNNNDETGVRLLAASRVSPDIA